LNYLAEQRALALLPRVLDPRERAYFERTGRILITGSEGGMYEIQRGSCVGNVVPQQRVSVGRIWTTSAGAGSALCAHPAMVRPKDNGFGVEELPPTDAHIAQILALKADERGFLRIANLYSYYSHY